MAAANLTVEVVELALEEVAELERERTPVRSSHPASRWLLQWIPGLVSRFLAGHLERSARVMAKRAVWFRGAREALIEVDGADTIDPDGKLQERLVKIERNLLTIREGALEIAASVRESSGATTRLRQACEILLQAVTEGYEEARAFRGALLQHDANRTAVREGFSASSPEEVDAVLRRIFEEA